MAEGSQGARACVDPIRVLIADDHALFRCALEMVLKKEPGIELVGQASDGAEAVRMAGERAEPADPRAIGCEQPPEPALEETLRRQNVRVVEANKQPGIVARVLGSMLETVREIAGLSYVEAAERLGCEADWLVRVETGYAEAGPEEVERILVEYGARGARAADMIIDMARRAASPPTWLAPHTSWMSAADRDLVLVEAQATLAQVHGFRVVPYLVQTEGYFREVAPAEAMADQVRHLLSLADSPHATVRVIPSDAAFWEQRRFNFDVLSFAGTTDRIGVAYSAIGAHLASGDDLYDAWTLIESDTAASPSQSQAILERHLAALS